MTKINEIKNVREPLPENTKADRRFHAWEQIQLLVLALTIFGQCVVGCVFLLGQSVWFIANLIALVRDFALHRPYADKIKNACLLAITCGIIIASVLI